MSNSMALNPGRYLRRKDNCWSSSKCFLSMRINSCRSLWLCLMMYWSLSTTKRRRLLDGSKLMSIFMCAQNKIIKLIKMLLKYIQMGLSHSQQVHKKSMQKKQKSFYFYFKECPSKMSRVMRSCMFKLLGLKKLDRLPLQNIHSMWYKSNIWVLESMCIWDFQKCNHLWPKSNNTTMTTWI